MTNSFVEVSLGNVNPETAEKLRKYLAEHSPEVQISARDKPVGFSLDDYNPEVSVEDLLLKGKMTLRDYFAAEGMASLLSNSDAMDEAADGCDSDIELMANVADRAYAMADAMLAAREVVK